jgi:hypothetical protein
MGCLSRSLLKKNTQIFPRNVLLNPPVHRIKMAGFSEMAIPSKTRQLYSVMNYKKFCSIQTGART